MGLINRSTTTTAKQIYYIWQMIKGAINSLPLEELFFIHLALFHHCTFLHQ